MPQYESITNAGEFISDHFLTSDETKASFLKQVRDLRRGWNQAHKDGETTTHSRIGSRYRLSGRSPRTRTSRWRWGCRS